jgi:GNAT superfamily N-acetyltransferase
MIYDMHPDDWDDALRLAKELHAESPTFRAMEFHDEAFRHYFDQVINPKQPDLVGWVLKDNADAPVYGGMIAALIPPFYSQDKFAVDLTIFVEQNRRGGRGAVMLLKKYKAWAQYRGAKQIQLGIGTEINLQRTTRFYERMGFKVTGHQLTLGK